MKKLLPLFLLSLSYSTYAQTEFRPGYVVPASGDTLRGEVDYRGAQRNAVVTRFRTNGQVTEYSPAQLRGYGFAGEKAYQTASVPTMNGATQTVFLEVVEAGPASLLYMRDGNGADRLYLRMGAGDVQPLEQITQQRQINGTKYEQKDNAYQRVLAATMQNCPAIQPELSRVRYSRDAIAKTVRTYNACVGGGPGPATTGATTRSALRVEALVGGETARLQYEGPQAGHAFTDRSSIVPVVGLGGQVQLSGVNRHLAVRLEALYEAPTRYEAEYEYSQDNFRRHQQVQVELSTIRVPLLLRYTLPGRHVQPFAQAGISASYFLTSRNEGRSRFIDRPAFPDYSAWTPLVESPRKIEQGLLGSVGLSYTPTNGHTLAAELRYEHSKGFSSTNGTTTNLSRFFFLLAYSLTK